MKHPNLTILAGAVLLSIGPLASAQTATVKATVSGKIANASNPLLTSATAGASQIGRNPGASSNMQVTFVDPTKPTTAEWAAGIGTNSQGSLNTTCRTWNPRTIEPPPRDGRPAYQCRDLLSELPPWNYGNPPQRTAGASGRFTYQAGPAMPGYRANEVRFMATETGGVGSEEATLSARSSLAQGRTETSAMLEFRPGLWGLLEPPSCKGDLVVEIRYGIDGRHDPDPASWVVANRWLDLDLNYSSNVFRPTAQKWGRVSIRAEGQPKTAPQRAGWPDSTGVTRSNVFVDTSDGTSTIQTIDWQNGIAAIPGVPVTQYFNTWTTHTLRIPVTVGTATRFNLTVNTHQSSYLQRTVPGGSETPTAGPNGKGHGIDLRMYLENMRAVDPKTPASHCRLPA